MTTLREIREAEARRRVEQRASEETSEERHERYLADARANGIRNLTADEYKRASELAGAHHPGAVVGWPLDAPAMFNGTSEPCDMWSGPCACGAWHKEGI